MSAVNLPRTVPRQEKIPAIGTAISQATGPRLPPSPPRSGRLSRVAPTRGETLGTGALPCELK